MTGVVDYCLSRWKAESASLEQEKDTSFFLMETLDVVADESAVKICIAEIISTAGQTGHR